jgi:hypothetical protein
MLCLAAKWPHGSPLRKLEVLNPKDGSGNRSSKHHQWLTDEIGHPALSHHIHAVIGLMRASTTWAGLTSSSNGLFRAKGTNSTFWTCRILILPSPSCEVVMHRGHAGHMADGPLRQLPGGITRYGS